MKIILVIPTLKQGGAERVISELANNFAIIGHDVNIVLLAKAEQFYKVNENVKIHELNFSSSNKYTKLFKEFSILFQLRKLIIKIDPNFTISFMTKYNILTLIASLLTNNRVFVSDRSNPKENLPFALKYGRKILYKFADGIIAQTELARDILYKETKNANIQVIPNPIKDIVLDTTLEKENIILNIGRLVHEKGQIHLLNSFASIKNDNWKIVILGEGPLLNDLKKHAVLLNIEDKVIFKGAVIDIGKYLSISKIFAFPSISEGFPNALAEAMSVGLASISFDCDAGPSELINNEINGYLIPLKNEELLSNKLSLLMNDEELRNNISKNSKEIKKLYDSMSISKTYLNFCKKGKE